MSGSDCVLLLSGRTAVRQAGREGRREGGRTEEDSRTAENIDPKPFFDFYDLRSEEGSEGGRERR